MTDYTLSFSERVKGWVSFKSFYYEGGQSMSGNYYTFKYGKLWRHHDHQYDYRNTFYNSFTASSFTAVLNDMPGVIKSFKTVNYEGSDSRIEILSDEFDNVGQYNTYLEDGVTINQTLNSPDYYNLKARSGWYVETIKTDLQRGHVNEFIEKEGKWFNYIKGKGIDVNDETGYISLDDYGVEGSSIIQGGGLYTTMSMASAVGCMDPLYMNFNPLAIIDDPNDCGALITYGCTDDTPGSGPYNYTDVNGNGSYYVTNYDPNANTDDGSCLYAGCTDITATNYDPNAGVDDGSCIPTVYGCTDGSTTTVSEYNITLTWNTYQNYDPNATVNQVSAFDLNDPCEYATAGCTQSTASNYNSNATADDGSCLFSIFGCSDNNACNPIVVNPWDVLTDDGSCEYCNNSTADNYDGFPGTSCPDLTTCNFCVLEDTFGGGGTYSIIGITDSSINFGWTTPNGELANEGFSAQIQYFKVRYKITGTSTWTVLSPLNDTNGINGFNQYNSPPVGDYNWSYNLQNLSPDTQYRVQVKAVCVGGTSSSWSDWTIQDSTLIEVIPGCTANNGDAQSGPNSFPSSGYYSTAYPNVDPGLTACNWNPLANQDDGSCEFTSCAGCNDSNYFEAWDLVTDPTGSTLFNYVISDQSQCENIRIDGCTTSGAQNYDSSATFDDGSCQAYVYGCTWGDQGSYGLFFDYNSTVFPYHSERTNMFDSNATHPCNANNDGQSLYDGGAGAGNNECCEHVGSSNVDEVFSCPVADVIWSNQQSNGAYGNKLKFRLDHNNMSVLPEVGYDISDPNVGGGGHAVGSNLGFTGGQSGKALYYTLQNYHIQELLNLGNGATFSTDATTSAPVLTVDVPYTFTVDWNNFNAAQWAMNNGAPMPPALDNKTCNISDTYTVIGGCWDPAYQNYDITTDVNYAPNANFHIDSLCGGPMTGCDISITDVDPTDYVSNPPHANQVNNLQYFMSYDPNANHGGNVAVNANQCKICKPPVVSSAWVGLQNGYPRIYVVIDNGNNANDYQIGGASNIVSFDDRQDVTFPNWYGGSDIVVNNKPLYHLQFKVQFTGNGQSFYAPDGTTLLHSTVNGQLYDTGWLDYTPNSSTASYGGGSTYWQMNQTYADALGLTYGYTSQSDFDTNRAAYVTTKTMTSSGNYKGIWVPLADSNYRAGQNIHSRIGLWKNDLMIQTPDISGYPNKENIGLGTWDDGSWDTGAKWWFRVRSHCVDALNTNSIGYQSGYFHDTNTGTDVGDNNGNVFGYQTFDTHNKYGWSNYYSFDVS